MPINPRISALLWYHGRCSGSSAQNALRKIKCPGAGTNSPRTECNTLKPIMRLPWIVYHTPGSHATERSVISCPVKNPQPALLCVWWPITVIPVAAARTSKALRGSATTARPTPAATASPSQRNTSTGISPAKQTSVLPSSR